MATLKILQTEVAETQNENWAKSQDRSGVYEQNFNIPCNCDKLVANQQPNFVFNATFFISN